MNFTCVCLSSVHTTYRVHHKFANDVWSHVTRDYFAAYVHHEPLKPRTVVKTQTHLGRTWTLVFFPGHQYHLFQERKKHKRVFILPPHCIKNDCGNRKARSVDVGEVIWK
jgi:hypothetical protein